MKSRFLISSSILVALHLTTHAATINWGLATDVVDANDISTTGTAVQAFNLTFNTDSVDTTINGVFFDTLSQPTPLTNSAGTPSALDGNTTGDASYDLLLNTNAFGGGTSTTFTLTGLTALQDYEIQLWYVEQRTAQAGRVMTYGDGGGNTIALAGDAGSFGQYGIGTFTADSTSQDITLTTSGFGQAHLSAYQLRLIPEPSAFALLSGVLALSLVASRRRK